MNQEWQAVSTRGFGLGNFVTQSPQRTSEQRTENIGVSLQAGLKKEKQDEAKAANFIPILMTSGMVGMVGGGLRSFPHHRLVPGAEQRDLCRLTLKICSGCPSLDLTFLSFKTKTKTYENVTAQRGMKKRLSQRTTEKSSNKGDRFLLAVRKGHLSLVPHKRRGSRRGTNDGNSPRNSSNEQRGSCFAFRASQGGKCLGFHTSQVETFRLVNPLNTHALWRRAN